MAGNFWKSSHNSQWIFDKSDLVRERARDMKNITDEEYQKVMIFYCNFIHAIGTDTLNGVNNKVKMHVIATACVYFRRFYARQSFMDIDPFLLAPTCICLASKADEFSMMSTSKLISTVSNALKKWTFLNQEILIRPPYIQEAEFLLLEIMDCCLIVYHPYRTLHVLITDLKNTYKELKADIEVIHGEAVKYCNDHYRSDICILYPPHQIAYACLVLAMINLKKQDDYAEWFTDSSVEIDKVHEIIVAIGAMYRVWKDFIEKEQLPKILEKIPRPNTRAAEISKKEAL
uniref:Cyclin-C n=1 Tax=Rhabditophanes sp. KR3021 TaxID=114890 RepID=A0AC35TKM8_9BILA